MALSIAGIKAVLKAKREAQFGTPVDPAQADKSYQADAEALFQILTVDASTVLNNGLDSGGDTLTDLTGKIV